MLPISSQTTTTSRYTAFYYSRFGLTFLIRVAETSVDLNHEGVLYLIFDRVRSILNRMLILDKNIIMYSSNDIFEEMTRLQKSTVVFL